MEKRKKPSVNYLEDDEVRNRSGGNLLTLISGFELVVWRWLRIVRRYSWTLQSDSRYSWGTFFPSISHNLG